VSAATLQAALDTLGIACTVEPHDRLAVIVPVGGVDPLESRRVRGEALRLARDHGFTHIAVELVEYDPSAARDGERGRTETLPHRAALHRD
jgi:hypothetical protein